jgi:hypothetical protein
MRATTLHGRRPRDFSPEWLATLRFISRRETSVPPAWLCYVGPSGVGAYASEVKRSAASHEDAKAPRFGGRVIGPSSRVECRPRGRLPQVRGSSIAV